MDTPLKPAAALTPPDISPYRGGNTGVDYITTLDSGRAGPHVMIAAVVHGNEPCGAVALDFLFRHDVRPRMGRLTLAFMNVAAYGGVDPANPNAARHVDEDFNRLWMVDVLDGARDSNELRRARAVRPIVDQVDFLLDIHSMQTTAQPLMLAGTLAKGRALAQALCMPRLVIADAGHAAGRRLRDYAGFGDGASRKNALLVECGQHWARGAGEVAIEVALRFLRHLGIIGHDFAGKHVPVHAPPKQAFIEVTEAVTIRSDKFRFAQEYRGLEVIGRAGTILGHDGDTAVRTPYDQCVLIMPSRRLARGQTAVRLGRFVEAG